MHDGRLDELERRWHTTRSPADEAAWLRHRVALRDLDQARLELAATCGHEAAGRACGVVGASAAPRLDETARLLFQQAEPPTAAVGARCVALVMRSIQGPPELLGRAAGAIEDYAGCPCEAHRGALFLLASQVGRLAASRLSRGGAGQAQAFAIKAVYHVCQAVQRSARGRHSDALGQLLQALEAARRAGVGEPELARALQAGLVAWALAPYPSTERAALSSAAGPTS